MTRIKLLLSSLGLAGGVFVCDQWTKRLFFSAHARDLFPPFLQTTTHHNFGLLANIPVPLPLILLFTSAVLIFALFALRQSLSRTETLRSLALACIIGGASGNLLDRVVHGFVFDWILLFRLSVINIADIAIGVGILLLLITLDQGSEAR